MNTFRRTVAFLLGAIVCGGCRSVSWDPPPIPIGMAPDSLTAVRVFEEMVPHRLQITHSMLFQHGRSRLKGSGSLVIDSERREFSFLASDPSGKAPGMRLFEIVSAGGDLQARFAVKPFIDDRALADDVTRDVPRMYFDLVPPDNSESSIQFNTLIARSQSGSNATEWVYGAGNQLLEKRYFEGSNLVEQVGYYEYSLDRGRRVPHRVMMHNLRLDYALTVTLEKLVACE